MNSCPVCWAAAASERPSATVAATGFSPSTGKPALSAAIVTGWCASGMVAFTIASAPVRRASSTASAPVARPSMPVAAASLAAASG